MASLVFKPALSVSKTSIAFADSISLSNPKMIPNAVAEYTITTSSPASYTVTANSIGVIDTTPINTALMVSDINGAGSGPALFLAGASGLTYSFISLASTTDDVEFSNNNGVSWNYTPVASANGTDSSVTGVRLRPKGTMAASATFSFKLRYRLN